MSLVVACAHARFSEERRRMLAERVLPSWEGGVRTVVCDDEGRGSWHTVRAAWEEALELAGGDGHVLVAQDDMRLAEGGYQLMSGLCDQFPSRVFSFRWSQAVERWAAPWVDGLDECYLQVCHAWGGGCVALPVKLAEEFLAWSVDYERVLRSIPHHKPDWLDEVLRSRDDFRCDLWLISRQETVWRLRWSLLEHLGDMSVVRGGRRPPSPEVNLVRDVSSLPALDDPRWVGEDAPSCQVVPNEYRSAVGQLFGPRAGELGLAHARW